MKQISLLVFLLAALTDWYDGWLARKFNYITEWGKFLDPLADKILTSATFFAFVVLDVLPLWMVIVIAVRDFIITGLRSYAEYKKQYFRTSIHAKWKTFFQMLFLYYLLLVYTASTFEIVNERFGWLLNVLLDDVIVYYTMFAVTLLTAFSGLIYFYENKTLIKKLFSYEA